MPANKRVVVTGIGIISSIGTGKDVFWQSLRAGKSGIRPITLFDTSTTRAKTAGEITDFKAESFLGERGLRTFDRVTKLVLSAAKLALDDTGFKYPLDEDLSVRTGVSLGSTLGSVWSISEFDKQGLREGPSTVNPALFPNTVINAPASQISIKYNIKGFNTTISTGFASSLDAIDYAANFIKLYDYDVVLAGGVEELCLQTFLGFHKIGHLAGSREGKAEVNCPFDKRRNGIILGEGACIFILEEMEHARKRGANIYAEILGYGASFDPKSKNVYSPKADGATRAIKLALEESGTAPDEIDYISACANSTLDCDVMETRAVNRVFSDNAKKIPVSSIKSMIGDTFSASGAMNVAASIGAIKENFIPPTINYEVKDIRCDLDYVPNNSRDKKVAKVLINSFTPTGANSSLVVGKVAG
ncbi:MAG: beta-ketoacyl-[acyl-carrier-protein] synthase family protein [Candidatus Omnitrophica bacterium]|nr:beta-ketoacyl-[acyl-carrier-protein] synthase family protein [Candidatus Omnitrophota bacterium]